MAGVEDGREGAAGVEVAAFEGRERLSEWARAAAAAAEAASGKGPPKGGNDPGPVKPVAASGAASTAASSASSNIFAAREELLLLLLPRCGLSSSDDEDGCSDVWELVLSPWSAPIGAPPVCPCGMMCEGVGEVVPAESGGSVMGPSEPMAVGEVPISSGEVLPEGAESALASCALDAGEGDVPDKKSVTRLDVRARTGVSTVNPLAASSASLLACKLRRTPRLREPPCAEESIMLPLGAGDIIAGEAVRPLSMCEPASPPAAAARDERRVRPRPLSPATEDEDEVGGMRGVPMFGEKPGVPNGVELESPSFDRSGDR